MCVGYSFVCGGIGEGVGRKEAPHGTNSRLLTIPSGMF